MYTHQTRPTHGLTVLNPARARRVGHGKPRQPISSPSSERHAMATVTGARARVTPRAARCRVVHPTALLTGSMSRTASTAQVGWLRLADAARALGVPRQTVLHKVQRGQLDAVQAERRCAGFWFVR